MGTIVPYFFLKEKHIQPTIRIMYSISNFIFGLLFGVFCLAFGVFTLFYRKSHPEKFGKLQKMQERFGEKAGYVIHWINYTLIPIVLGLFLIIWFILTGKSPL